LETEKNRFFAFININLGDGHENFDFNLIYEHLKNLAGEILTIQARGDYKEALRMINTYAVDSPSIKSLRDKLESLPVDIKPVFQIEKVLSAKQ